MDTKRYLRFALYVGASSIVMVTIALHASGARQPVGQTQAQSEPPVPFTASLEETAYDKNGKGLVASYQTFAVQADGTALLKLGLDDDAFRQIVDPTGQKVRAYRGHKSTTKFARPPLRRSMAARCVYPGGVEYETGERLVDGYRAVVVTVKGDDRSTETSYALDYGCAMLDRTMRFATGELSVLKLTSFIPGEPEASLFATNGLEEGPPSALSEGPAQTPGCKKECQDRLVKILKARDASYFYNRARNDLVLKQ